MAKGGTVKDTPYESVTTPIYKPVTARTVYLEGTKAGYIPKEVKYKDFTKNPEPYIKAAGGAYKYDPKVKSGTVSGFTKRFEDIQEGVTGKPIYQKGRIDKFPDGGTVDPQQVRLDYMKNLRDVPQFLRENIYEKEGVSEDVLRNMGHSTRTLFNEMPNSMSELMSSGSQDEMRYINNLVGRLEPHMTPENAEILVKGNSPLNVMKKINLVKDLPLYKSDLDSIQKYMPDFYEMNNLKMAKPFLSGDELPEYPMGGMIPYGQPNAELEGGESFVTPDGQDFNVEGPSHANGGVPLNLPSGTDVF